MRKIYKLLFPLIAVLGLFKPFSASATHVMGCDITWKCLGDDSFQIIVHAFRDCNGIMLDGTGLTYQTTGDTCASNPVNASPKVCCGTDITPVCSRSCSRCISNSSCVFPYGIEQFTITSTVYLSPPCCNYTIAWEENARNSNITTGAANQTFYMEAQLNRCIKPCVSSPYFTNPPVAIFCTNQCIVYNPGVDDDSRDAEGRADSLAYSFGTPQSGQGANIPYDYPYTNDAPLIYAGTSKHQAFIPPTCYGFHLDSITGDLEFKAIKPDITVMNIIVTIYRRDTLGIERPVGYIQRGLEIIVIDCPADHPPIIPGINGGTTYSEKICADQQTCFQVKAFDLDLADTDYLSWNNPGSMTGASFNVVPNGQKWPTAVFCWYPTDKDVRSYPYTFIVTAIDNACPIPGRASKAFSVYVIAAPSANYSATVQKCGMVYFQASPAKESSTAIAKYLWVGEGAPGFGPLYKIGKTASYQYTKGGTYHYNLVVTGPNGCTRTYADSVTIAAFPGISLPHDTALCDNSPTISVTAKPVNAFQPYKIWWNFKDSKGDSLTSGTISEKITHDTAFRVNILDQGCTNYDSMKVRVIALPKPNIGPDQRGCWSKGIMLTTGLKHMPVANWTFIKGNKVLKNFAKGDTIIVNDSGTYVVSVNDSIGCPGTDSVNVFFNPLVQVRNLDTTVCYGDSVTLRAGIGGSGASYSWIDIIHNKTVGTGPTYKFLATGSAGHGVAADFKVVIKQSQHGLTCADTGYINATVNTPSHAILDSLKPKCIDDPAIELGTSPPWVDKDHTNGTWYSKTNPKAIVGNFLYPSIMGRTDNNHTLGWVHYLYANAYKCITDDSARINISNQPQVSAGPDTTICTGNGKYLLNNKMVTPVGGLWFALKGTPSTALTTSKNHDSIFFDPNSANISDTVYSLVYQYQAPSGNGKSSCGNSDTVNIRVRTNPTVTVPRLDSLCLNANPYPLNGFNPTAGILAFAPGDKTYKGALQFNKFNQSYTFYADSAGVGWHKMTYTAFGDRQRSLCPTIKTDSIYVIPAPTGVDFHTSDASWEYCVNHSKVTLIPTGTYNGKPISGGSFVAGKEVYLSNKQYYFDPSLADTVSPNKILFVLPYNKNQCQVNITHNIKVDSRPSVEINSSPNVCVGQGGFELTATRHNSTGISWSSDGSKLGFVAKNSDSTDVIYTTTDGQQRSGKFSIEVKVTNHGDCAPYIATREFIINPAPSIVFNSNRAGCEPLIVHFNSDSVSVGSVLVSSNPAVVKGYDWDFGDGSPHSQSPNPYHVYKVTNGKDTQQFNVTLTVTSDSGCVLSLTKNSWVTAYATPKPVISANPQFTTIALPQIQFTFDPKSSGIDFSDPKTTYRWSFGDSSHAFSTEKSPQYTYGDTGTFKVRVAVSSKGCVGDTFITVYIQPELIIYIPNVFKPDNKHGGNKTTGHESNYFSANENNTFQPVISAYESFQMNIYNRWGQLMYTTNDPKKGWNGWFEGHEPVQDAYVYVIKTTGFSGKPYTFTGTVTLLY